MAANRLPLLIIRRKNGKIEELTVGPSAGRTLVIIVMVVTQATLMSSGAITWGDLAPLLRAIVKF
jgi:hypothetical protein